MFHDPTFWVAVAFVIIVAAVFRPVGRAVVAALDDRSARIAQQLDEAQDLREEAQKTGDSTADALQQELSRVLIERSDEIQEAVAQEREKLQQETAVVTAQMKVETAQAKEDVIKAREQLYQWQHLAENLLSTIQTQDMFLSEDQKQKLNRMSENYQNLSNLLKMLQ